MQRDREELNVHVLADFFIFFFVQVGLQHTSHKPDCD